jgi:hypothetical protein
MSNISGAICVSDLVTKTSSPWRSSGQDLDLRRFRGRLAFNFLPVSLRRMMLLSYSICRCATGAGSAKASLLAHRLLTSPQPPVRCKFLRSPSPRPGKGRLPNLGPFGDGGLRDVEQALEFLRRLEYAIRSKEDSGRL